jgi:hypothetical protein
MLESFLNKDLEQRLKEKVPLGYIADPSDIAKVILF